MGVGYWVYHIFREEDREIEVQAYFKGITQL